MAKKIFFSVFILLIIIQFFRPDKNVSAGSSDAAIENQVDVTPEVAQLLRASCYDCHSNNTKYPWYNNIQPLAWWLNNHINEGKRELNFDEFGNYAPKKQKKKLHEIEEQLQEKEMPLRSYTLIHRDAALSDSNRRLIADWAKSAGSHMIVPAK